MIKKIVPLFFPAMLGMFAACQSTKTESTVAETDSIASITTESYVNYVAELASDSLLGRKPFTEGENKTLAYLKKEAKELGLEPGNGNSYVQEVPMVEISTTAAPTMTVKGKKNFQLKGLKDYVIWTRRMDESISLNQEELVFAGFGIVAPEYNWNDYEGLDVKDKVVVVLVNDPGFYAQDSSLFNGKAMTYYGRWTYKYDEAARQGAKGCLIIHETAPAGYGFNVVQNNWNASKLYLDPRGQESYKCAIEGWVTQEVAKQLFDAAGMNLQNAMANAMKPESKPIPMNLAISTSLTVKTRFDKTNNFIAKITGSKRPEENIIYTAHWDHLGIGKADETGDSIYNGAVDNASGVAGMLEIAKAFQSLPEKPERTVVFLAVTAEEQGLWGSAYYAENPVFPKEKTVANINMDMMNPYGKTKDIVVIGKGQSELEDLLAEEAKQAGRYVVAEPTPEAGLYYRSDHFNFAKVGIPALFTGFGIDHAEKGKEHGSSLQKTYVAGFYHKPSDEINTDWSWEGAVDDLKLLYSLGKRLANSQEWPQWKSGSEFKAARDAYMK
jgi:Zn-dependent M28 family amino/carboxypeptidase